MKVCDLLDKKEQVKNLKADDGFYYYKFAHAANCSKIQLSPEVKEKITYEINFKN